MGALLKAHRVHWLLSLLSLILTAGFTVTILRLSLGLAAIPHRLSLVFSGVLAATIAALLWSFWQLNSITVFLYEGGLCLKLGRKRVRIRWENIAAAREITRIDSEGQQSTSYVLRTHAGTAINVPTEVEDFRELWRFITQRVADGSKGRG